ncbi:MAG: 50S ribosomal protein L3 [Thermodesulfobacteriota bacterium]
MSSGVLGKKLGMTSMFLSDGTLVPVTVVKAGPCVVTQIKTDKTDGYNALQLGFGEKKESRINKPKKGHLKKSGGHSFAFLREFPVDAPENFRLGQTLSLEMFKVGDRVHVTGTSKGRGFSGTIKRHGSQRGPETHGSHCVRIPGSIGSSAWPSRVVKGKRFPGHYGNEKRTIQNLEIVDLRTDEFLILLKGAVPGTVSGLIEIKKTTLKRKSGKRA